MKHSPFAAARAAPLHGLLATAALHALAAAPDAENTPTLAPAATDLDTGQPLAIGLTLQDRDYTGKKHARRDSAGPPIGVIRGKRVVGTDKAQGGGSHRRREVALN